MDIMGSFDKPRTHAFDRHPSLSPEPPYVVAVGGQVGSSAANEERGSRGYSTITLSVSPEEAEIIEFARRKTKLIFARRNAADPGDRRPTSSGWKTSPRSSPRKPSRRLLDRRSPDESGTGKRKNIEIVGSNK
ncbi:MAG: hypothetical protein MZV63_63475 [Marinilabiliales bacterium]|nr:hypothetical protein [Marinilabiliales bacterium]